MKSRRWRHGAKSRCVLPTLILGFFAATAIAGCPPGDTDGAVVRKDELLLAYRLSPYADTANPARIPMAKHFSLEVQLCTGLNGRDTSFAQLLKVDASMPEHKHGMNYRPIITPLGSGRFRVEGLMFHMAGHWRLDFDVQSANGTLRLDQDLQIQ